MLYGTNPDQNINVRVGLPLNSLDGGTGGVQGAWNGRTQGIGGGGCSGSLAVNGPVNTGYVGSGNDTGHSGGDCEPGVNPRRHVQPAVHQRLHPQRDEAADPFLEGDREDLLRHQSRPTTTGTAARPADGRATCSRRSSRTNSTASSPMRPRSTGRDSRPRRCGARSR